MPGRLLNFIENCTDTADKKHKTGSNRHPPLLKSTVQKNHDLKRPGRTIKQTNLRSK